MLVYKLKLKVLEIFYSAYLLGKLQTNAYLGTVLCQYHLLNSFHLLTLHKVTRSAKKYAIPTKHCRYSSSLYHHSQERQHKPALKKVLSHLFNGCVNKNKQVYVVEVLRSITSEKLILKLCYSL